MPDLHTACLQTWRMDSPRQTWVLAGEGGTPECVYWGSRLPDQENLSALVMGMRRPIGGATLDEHAPLSLCPEESLGFQGHPGIEASSPDGKRYLPRFQLQLAQVASDGLHFQLQDQTLGLQLDIHLIQSAGETLKAHSTVTLTGEQAVRIDWLSAPVFPVPDHSSSMLDFSGRWCGELQPQLSAWNAGTRLRESREGRTGHGDLPLFFTTAPHSNNTQGEVRAWHLGWSGGHRMLAEELKDGRRQVQFGMMHASRLLQERGDSLQTPPLYCAYSANGFNPVMHALHTLVRTRIVNFPDKQRPRPVHYNCWEAVYFRHDLATLKTIATKAAELGAERFVLDDGWFKGRNNDLAALGDWTVDPDKYPQGLHPLIAHIHQLGMSFGLWVEPEMVNPDSDLFRAHPEWLLGSPDQPTGRQQMVLDLAQPAVGEYLLAALSALLREYPIDYLKWDHNRVLIQGSPAQTDALYTLLARLRSEFPGVEIESCSSGGGRMDYGILSHTHRVWLSDSNDALERWRMQHEAALFLPPEMTGSHVGPKHCHTSGRVLSLEFQGWVAATRHLGFEMDPRELSVDDAAKLRYITDWWKLNRDWLFSGTLHRLDSYDPSVLAEMTVAADGSRFTLFAGQLQTSARNSTRLLRLTGLEAEASYRLHLINSSEMAGNVCRIWPSPLLSANGLVLSGRSLMEAGIAIPLAMPATLWVIEGHKIAS